MEDSAFVAAFFAAKERGRAMEYRCVEEVDQNRQAVLEIDCAIVLATPYNDFGTHQDPIWRRGGRPEGKTDKRPVRARAKPEARRHGQRVSSK
jgi:hypothetical protein